MAIVGQWYALSGYTCECCKCPKLRHSYSHKELLEALRLNEYQSEGLRLPRSSFIGICHIRPTA
nr:MAG TPA: hypothetical protein [Caudoviricetes sp.]